MTSIYALDPRDDSQPSQAVLATRPASLDGKTLGLLSNNKPHSEDLLRMVANIIGERYSLSEVVGVQQGRPSMARRSLSVGGPGQAMRRDDSRHG